ncbi:hypothetical protein BAUCODRAFT_518221 [Baudoinia panamericana UAMH 10762]|uniref:Linoleate 8R-lipoxygenase n=1 Tax=Baudoinia panamericana (strain UAMH 10762) TaxID=717646 RepID=M2LKV0_BAUPA|nr:uncharacterized protein BAUCODRAFT_518221 [Baudoinia panamericana UAMH 10762]EMC94912.1 hypothetical protein BAUCODRAFT_518221 [Baudoinia panamericana UAMH 10762]
MMSLARHNMDSMQTISKALSSVGHNGQSTPEPKPLSKLDEWTQSFGQSVTQAKTLLKAIRDPLPTQTGDGSELPPVQKESSVKILGEVLRDLAHLGPDKVANLVTVAKAGLTHELINDRDYRMERLIQAAAMLPPDKLDTKLTNDFVTQLWNDLAHPPQTLLSDEYQYRMPDGSKNNYLYPQVGAAGMPYARTVARQTKLPGSLPDPGVLFDSLMARRKPEGETHPNRISSMLFYLASIIIHDIFKTDHDDFNISDTSSYLDLAPLYGSNWKDQKSMRTFKDGKLKPDCFFEPRLLTFPPGVGAVLVMFNRYHNYVVEQLAAINEDGRFTEDPKHLTVKRYREPSKKGEPEKPLEEINKRDDDLFQTARLIVCGLYVNLILIDYVRTILNLNRTDENWQLNPRVDIPNGPPRGTGNQVSAEFNLVYRWHAAVSWRDDEWSQQLFREICPNMTPQQAAEPKNIYKFLGILAAKEGEFMGQDPMDRKWPALQHEVLQRIPDGPYKGNYRDDDIAKILTESIEDCANAYGPRQVPTVMKAIEILGIMQSRTWQVATLNEFRKHFGLTPHRTFDDITKDKEVAEALKHLYDTPDNVELYPGLVVEDAKVPMLPGSGLCPSYTVSRGVLSDAVALVRGDRFFTTNYTPASLTNWGFQEASSDLTIDNGCVWYKLFLRALPNNYDPASVYVHYPMTVPHGKDGMADVLTRLNKAHLYTNLTDRPEPIGQPTVVFSYDAATKIMENQQAFKVTWGQPMKFLMGPAAANFMLSGDGPPNAKSRQLMEKALYQTNGPPAPSRAIPTGDEKWLKSVRTFYERTTVKLLKQKSYTLAGTQYVDIIRDVGNMVHVHFAAELFSLPLKTDDFPRGILTEGQLYLITAAVFICVFFDVDPPKSFPLRQQARAATQTLGAFVKGLVTVIKVGGNLAEYVGKQLDRSAPELSQYGIHMIHQLVKADTNIEDLVWGNIMGTAGGMVANQGQLFGQAMDWFMTVDKENHWAKVQALARQNTAEADDKLMHYFMEASRLNGETGVFRWVDLPPGQSVSITDSPSLPDQTKPLGTQTHTFRSGDKVMVNLKAASRDPVAFPNPDSIDLNRSLDSYIHLGHGPHQCLGLPMTRVALTTMLKVIAKLDRLQPAPVAIGRVSTTSSVKKVVKEFIPGDLKVMPEAWHYHQFLTEDWDMYFPFPTSLKLTFAGPVPTT